MAVGLLMITKLPMNNIKSEQFRIGNWIYSEKQSNQMSKIVSLNTVKQSLGAKI